MESDVPLGAFLSGGIDSSIVVALMQQRSTNPVKTFTIGFDEDGYDESAHARAVADHLGTDHTELRLSASDALAVIPRLPRIYDEPFADSSQIPTFLVSELARQRVTVALSGDGGDEIFGGYDRYRIFQRMEKIQRRIPHSILRVSGNALEAIPMDFLNRLGNSSVAGLAPKAFRVRTGERVHKLAKILKATGGLGLYEELLSVNFDPGNLVIGFEDHQRKNHKYGWKSSFENAMLVDTVDYLPNDILVKVDRASMANSLEVRVPLLDPEVFDFAWKLNPADRVRDGIGKWPLRQLLKRYVPSEIIERPKMGFGVPIGKWLRTDLRGWADSLLDAQLINKQGYFYAEPITKMWAEHKSAVADRSTELWPILMFQAWLQEWHS